MLEEILKDLTAAIREQTEVLKNSGARVGVGVILPDVGGPLTNEDRDVQNMTEQAASAKKAGAKAQPKKSEPAPVVVTKTPAPVEEAAVEPEVVQETETSVAGEDPNAVRLQVRELATCIITKAVGEAVTANKIRVKEIAGSLGASESTIATVPDDRIIEFRDILKTEFAEHLAANGK